MKSNPFIDVHRAVDDAYSLRVAYQMACDAYQECRGTVTGDIATDYSLQVSDSPEKFGICYDFLSELITDMETNRGEIIGLFDKTDSGSRGPADDTYLTIGKIAESGEVIEIEDGHLKINLEEIQECKSNMDSKYAIKPRLLSALHILIHRISYMDYNFDRKKLPKPNTIINRIEEEHYPLSIEFFGDDMLIKTERSIPGLWPPIKSNFSAYAIGEESIIKQNKELYPSIPEEIIEQMLKSLTTSPTS